MATRPLHVGELLYEEKPLLEWSAEDAMQAQLTLLVAAALSMASALLLLAFNKALWAPLPVAAAAALWWPSFVPRELQEQWERLTVEQQEQLKGQVLQLQGAFKLFLSRFSCIVMYGERFRWMSKHLEA